LTCVADHVERDVIVVEVGPRDGLQNEAQPVPTERKIAFINALSAAGLPLIEATSFVNPRAVPQMADAGNVMRGIVRFPGVRYPVLVPNERGLERALEVGVDAIALFTAATDEFAQANVGTTIAGTFERFAPVIERARAEGVWVRGYVSVAFGCPYAGPVATGAVAMVVEQLLAAGCDEICLADTIGIGAPAGVNATLDAVSKSLSLGALALHFHDTTGNALRNVEVALGRGVRIFDSAAGGLGGCPFAPGAPGNLATESLLKFLHQAGLRTGVDLESIGQATDLLRGYVPRLGPVATPPV
jgi:isopropylmalate/homocitrate/citramalate synthase